MSQALLSKAVIYSLRQDLFDADCVSGPLHLVVNEISDLVLALVEATFLQVTTDPGVEH